MGILLWVAFAVLDEPAAEAGDEPAQLLHRKPGVAAGLLSVVHGEGDRGLHPMAGKPGDDPQVEAQAIGPGAFLGVGNELEAGVDIESSPLEVGDTTSIQVKYLLLSKGFVVADILQVYLHHLEGFSAVPVHERPW